MLLALTTAPTAGCNPAGETAGVTAQVTLLTADLSQHDPEVERIVARARRALETNAAEAAAWGRLGLAYEANYLPELAAPCYEEASARAPAAAQWSYRLGVVRERSDDLLGAIAAYTEATRRERAFAPAHWRAGFLQLERGDLAAARTAFRKATRSAPALPIGRIGIARVALQEDDPEAAIAILDGVLADHPDEAYARSLLASAYRQAGRWDEVAADFAGLTPTEAEWPDPASGDLARLRATTAIVREERAVNLARSGTNLARSIELLEDLVAEKGDDSALLTTLAGAYERHGRLRRARATYERALALEPDHHDSLVGLAGLHLRTDEPAAALVRIARAIELQPGFGKAHAIRGHALRASGDYAAALAAYEEALALDARNVQLRVTMGVLELELRNWEAARGQLERALAAGITTPELYVALARSRLQLELFDQAEAALEAVGQAEWPAAYRAAAERVRADLATRRAANSNGGDA